MAGLDKPDAHGSPGEKAQKALGEKLNRPAKPPPTMPGKKAEKRDPSSTRLHEDKDVARNVSDEVDEL
jgi:hypothetical protein